MASVGGERFLKLRFLNLHCCFLWFRNALKSRGAPPCDVVGRFAESSPRSTLTEGTIGNDYQPVNPPTRIASPTANACCRPVKDYRGGKRNGDAVAAGRCGGRYRRREFSFRGSEARRPERTDRPPRSPWVVECLEYDGALHTAVHRQPAREAGQGVDGTPRRVPVGGHEAICGRVSRRAARLSAILLAHVKTRRLAPP